MPNTKMNDVVQVKNVATTINVAMAVTAIKVTTIKKSFVVQMPIIVYGEFFSRVKDGSIIALGIARDLKDTADSLVLKTSNDRLMRTAEINYREYLNHVGHFDLELKGDDCGNYVDAEIRKLPQLFTV